MYSTTAVVNNTMLYPWKWLRESILNLPTTHTDTHNTSKTHTHTSKKQPCGEMAVLTNLIVVTTPQYTHVPNHHLYVLKLHNVNVNYVLINLGGGC